MKTEKQLLAEYTKLNDADWKILGRRREIKDELEAKGKDNTKRLRMAVRRLIRGTEWTLEYCLYWISINHAKRPVTASFHGKLELWHHRDNPRSLSKLEVGFSPADEERTLRYLEAIINATKP